MILAAAIPYFNTLFSGKFKDHNKTEISMRGYTSQALELCVDSAYGRKVNLNENSVLEVFQSSNTPNEKPSENIKR